MNDSASHRRTKFLAVVDDTPESSSALRYCCRRAKNTGGSVILLRVLEPADFQHWVSVQEIMQEEARQEAEELMAKLTQDVFHLTGVMPEVVIREGSRLDETLTLIDEDPDIRILVLGASTNKEGPGPLVSKLSGQMAGELHVPLIIVPGGMSPEAIDAVT
jgi:hypothetical protein